MSVFIEIFLADEQESKGFGTLFGRHLMMDLMGKTHGLEVGAVGVSEPWQTLVNKHVVDKEIGDAVEEYAETYVELPVELTVPGAGYDEKRRNDGEDDAEQVVFLESAVAGFVVAFMPVPHKAVHDVFVCEPGCGFHETEGSKHKTDVQ